MPPSAIFWAMPVKGSFTGALGSVKDPLKELDSVRGPFTDQRQL